ncbi:HET-domain-containing protein [Pleomassaria siparia CBS 279.74]|uniref:HET-domain-containing protein n=1 Tax=Pleomassaria siparia CBS 279.74 TaxID=1314801 RepID=A0A6G1K4J2_9PLEO|nr:HET-domain-containing protein [Pleomassaria siparia CBS 279.74]
MGKVHGRQASIEIDFQFVLVQDDIYDPLLPPKALTSLAILSSISIPFTFHQLDTRVILKAPTRMAHNMLKTYYYNKRKHFLEPQELYDDWKRMLDTNHSPNEDWGHGNGNDRRHSSPLFGVVLDDDVQLISLLLDYGAQLEMYNLEGRTALQESIIESSQTAFRLLLDRGARPDTPIMSEFLRGGTALHIAVTEGLLDVSKTLLRYGANPGARTDAGWTPADIAVLDHQGKMLAFLLNEFDISTMARRESPGADIEDHGDQVAIASHLLEHGVRGTERRHLSFYQSHLSRMVSELAHTTNDTAELSKMLIRAMDDFLMTCSKSTNVWDRKLCDFCRRFETQDPTDLYETFQHHDDYASLVRSSGNGCNLCQLLVDALENHWCLLHQIDRKWMQRLGVSPLIRLQLERRRGFTSPLCEYRLVVTCGDKISFMDLDHVQKHVNAAVAETGPSDAKGTGSERSLAVAKAWLQRCEDEHPSCRRQSLGRLPTRVIDVGDESRPPRIYTSSAELEPYVALSYCGGQDRHLCLLSTNADEYHKGIPSTLLPRTIADAITITRSMGLKYLWVDALCILQDSAEDLNQEISCMGDIYANSWLTIAAKDSASTKGGCFIQRCWSNSALVPLNIRLPGRIIPDASEPFKRTINTRTSSINRVMAIPIHRSPSSDDPIPVLETRGWALQEEILPRRILNCGRNELSWTCIESICTERQPREQEVHVENKFQSAFRRVLVTGVAGYNLLYPIGGTKLFNHWLEGVENYLQRTISDPRDKLVAWTGLQGAIGRVLDDTPVAGIWREGYFAPSLLWKSSNKETGKVVKAFPCPSWSWASVSHPVTYEKLPSERNKEKHWISYDKFEHFPKVIAWSVDDQGRGGIHGHVTLRCKLLREDDMKCEKHHVEDFLNRPPKGRGKAEAIHYETHHDFPEAANVENSWLMPVRTKQYILTGKDTGRFIYDIQTHLLRLEKMSPRGADFRRIGLVITRSWANKWLEMAKEEVIRLF